MGGIIGRIFYDQYSDRVYSSVSNCYNNGDISLSTAATDTAPSEYAYLGGICGWINATISIENCYNTGNVSISLVNSIGYFFAGGICGVIYTSNADPIADCYNTGNISSTVTNSDFFADSSVGGIYGAGFGLAKNCYNTGDISACSDLSEVGGIGGGGYNCIVIDCHNSGNLSSSAVYSDVGGIFGCCVGSTGIRNSSNTGTVTAAVSRYSSAGGMVGRGLANRYPSKNDPALTYKDTFTLSDCYNMGKVSISDADPSTEKESYGIAGGILGTLESYRSISISNCYNTGNLSAFDVGGILGEISYNVPNPTISISNCYWNIDSAQTAQGKPLASMDKKGGVCAPNSIDGVDGTTPLTTAQMKDSSNPNYTGFDFDTVWRFQKDVNDGYPVLQAYNAVTVEINGTPLFFPNQPPVIRDGRTLVPVRGVFEHLGYRVDWNPDTKTVTLKDDENRIVIREGEYAFTVNEKAYAFDVPAQIINDRIMIPFRLILESVGYLVEWDEDRAVVIVTTR